MKRIFFIVAVCGVVAFTSCNKKAEAVYVNTDTTWAEYELSCMKIGLEPLYSEYLSAKKEARKCRI